MKLCTQFILFSTVLSFATANKTQQGNKRLLRGTQVKVVTQEDLDNFILDKNKHHGVIVDDKDDDEDDNSYGLQTFIDFVREQEGPGGPRINIKDIIVEQDEDDNLDDDDDDDVEEEEVVVDKQEVDDEDDVDGELQAFSAFVHGKEGPDSPQVNLEDIIVEEDEDDDNLDEEGELVEEIGFKDAQVAAADGDVLGESPLDVVDARGSDTNDIAVQDTKQQVADVPQESDDDVWGDFPLDVVDATGTDTSDIAVQDTQEQVVDVPQESASTSAKHGESKNSTAEETISELKNGPAVFYGYQDYTCRSSDGSQGVPGEEYSQYYKSMTRESCQTECATEIDCKAYDYNEQSMQCQIWYFFYNTYQPKEGSHCYYKKAF